MSRLSVFSSPLLLGFDELERMLDRASKTSGDGYPPYNIERLPRAEGEAERLRITLAVAGFGRDELDVTVEENQLVIRGRQKEDDGRAFLHRGIAARQFMRTFVLADGMEVTGARLENGLLSFISNGPNPGGWSAASRLEGNVMKTNDVKNTLELTPEDLALLGGGALGYIREIELDEARKLLGGQAKVSPNSKLFCLYGADGTPVSISGSHEAAVGSAFEHELMPMSVH